jgi:hypothetical protein
MTRWIGLAMALTVALLLAYIVLALNRVRDGTDAIEETLKARLVEEAITACNAAALASGRAARFSNTTLKRAHFQPWKLLLTNAPAAEMVLRSEDVGCRYDFTGRASIYAEPDPAGG